ncbi:unnamed protein product [Anisakis simplex]|uniref:UDENN domain-containing protein n=1 Tax=Anisakis simplex TaxID=6269 RepID=A0A0M3J0K8_ANISI|nr:unnamed protein product [Anisakis simplex]
MDNVDILDAGSRSGPVEFCEVSRTPARDTRNNEESEMWFVLLDSTSELSLFASNYSNFAKIFVPFGMSESYDRRA